MHKVNIFNSIKFSLNNFSIVLPFLILALFEVSWLAIWYYAPRPPVSIVLAPLIKAFMGEHFLHYPLNFLALPRLVFLGRVFIYLAFAGVSIAATVAAVFQKEVEKSSVRYWGNFNRAVRKIPALFMLGIIYAIGLFLIYIIPKLIVLHLVGSERFLTIGYYGAYFFSFIFFVVMESALVYAVAFLIVYKHGLFSSIKKSTLFFKNHFAFTLFLVFSFRVINFALVLAKFKIVSIINKFFPFFPEFTLVILGAEIFFLLISNYFIIASACHLLLTKEGNK